MGQASTTLTVGTAQAIAELDLVIAKARQARAETQGLPSPTNVPNARSIRLPPMPSADIPGGKAAEFASQQMWRPSPGATAAAGIGGKSAVVPSAFNAQKLAAMVADPSSPPALLPTAASMASAMARSSNVEHSVLRKLTEVEIKKGKLEMGPLELGTAGLGVQSNFARKLVPAAVYGMIAYGAVKALSEGLDTAHEAIVEAAKSGRDPGAVLLEKGSAKLASAVGGVGAFAVEAGGLLYQTSIKLAQHWLTAPWYLNGPIGWAAQGIAAALGYAYDAKKAEDVSADLAALTHDAVARIAGGQTMAQIRRTAFDSNTASFIKALDKASDYIEVNSRKAAEQLLGLGFPGSRRELREISEEVMFGGGDRHSRAQRVLNGVTHNGE